MKKFYSKIMAALVVVGLLFSLSLSADAQTRRYRRNPEAGKKKAAKRIGIGAAIGAGAGALIGGRKGAIIGGAVGAGGGGIYHVKKKRDGRKRIRRY